jgi:hypothetical protein
MQSNKSFQSSLNLKNKLKQPKFVHICVEKTKSRKTNRKLEKKKKTKNFDYQSINIKLV